jgi:FkbM family methyltransferase
MLINKLSHQIRISLFNRFSDNFDYHRFGKNDRKRSLLRTSKFILLYFSLFNKVSFRKLLDYRFGKGYIKKLEFLYSHLDDSYSKDLVVRLISYRLLGYTKVKLIENTQAYFSDIKKLEGLAEQDNSISISFGDYQWKLFKINLDQAGYPIQIYYTPQGAYTTFVLGQYEYSRVDPAIRAREGEVVLDAGGCFGDTALYFANAVGPEGKVFTFEFIPENVEILKKNISLNLDFKNNIEIIENPVWEISNKEIFFKNNGPASRLSFEPFNGYDAKIYTIAIDDFIETKKINRIDFIKMDIEGAELNALKGSMNTIIKFKPKLAISIYHSLNDFVDIIRFLNEIVPEYHFYLGHYTTHLEETILFAVI